MQFIVNNSPCSLLWRLDIVLSTSFPTSYLSHTYDSEEALISLFWPFSNWTTNFLLSNTDWTYPTTYLLIQLVIHSLVLSFISPTFTTDTTPIFILIRFLSFIFVIVLITGKLMVYLMGGGGVLSIVLSIRKSTVELGVFCEKSFQQK